MKKEKCWKSLHGCLCAAVLALFTFGFTSCKDDDLKGGFDPSKPIVVTDFMPKEAGYGNNLMVYGNNFGNDVSKISVTVGGKQANVISVKNDALYCVVPKGAYGDEVEVSACDDEGEEIAYAVAEAKFTYKKQWLVTTIAGQRFEDWNDAKEAEGSFDNCGYMEGISWFAFDPKSNFDIMYISSAALGPVRKVNFANETVEFLSHISYSTERPTIITWTPDENQDMVVTRDLSSSGNVNIVYSRASGFTTKVDLESTLGKLKSGNAAMIHPDGQLYYTAYYTQDIYRYDFATKETTIASKHVKTKENLRLVLHPSGKYAYMMRLYYSGNNSGYIARLDYDDEAKTFGTPYIVAGSDGSAGYADGGAALCCAAGGAERRPVPAAQAAGHQYAFDVHGLCPALLDGYGKNGAWTDPHDQIQRICACRESKRRECRTHYPQAYFTEQHQCHHHYGGTAGAFGDFHRKLPELYRSGRQGADAFFGFARECRQSRHFGVFL